MTSIRTNLDPYRKPLRHVLAVTVIALALALRWAIVQVVGELPPFITFYPAVMLVALFAGLGPGLLATALAALATYHSAISSPRLLVPHTSADIAALGLFSAAGALMSVVAELYRRARERAAAYQKDLALRESEERFRVIFEEAPLGMVIGVGDGVISKANRAVCRLSGYTEDELIGRHVSDLAYPEDRELTAPLIKRLLAGEIPSFTVEKRYLAKDGQPFWAQATTAAVHGPDGKLAFAVGIVEDISDRKRAEEAVRESEKRFRALFEQSPDGILIVDPTSARFLDFNTAAHRQLGYTREEFAELSIMDVEATETAQETKGRIAGVIRNGKADFETLHRTRQGEIKNVHVTAQVAEVLDRPVYLCIWRDITDRKRAEQEKLEMERRLLHAQKLESVSILAGGVAHDFNNILAGIKNYAELLKGTLSPSDPAQADIAAIKKSVQRAADLTRQMLAYAGRGTFVVEEVSLSQIIEDAREMLEISVSTKATLKFDLASDLPAIQADVSQIHQVILNCVVNASEALGENGGAIVVSTDAVQLSTADCAAIDGGSDLREGRYVRLEVADTGCGMDRETLGKIFDPFFTTKVVGHGLGLAAVQGIIKGHKGAIHVASEPDKGTTFHAYFPVSGPYHPSRPSAIP